MIGRARRQGGQAGTTLVELVVSVAIIGLALTLLVGAFSTGVIQSTLVKRNTAVDAALGYELERIAAATYTTTPGPYSECFAVDSAIPPAAPMLSTEKMTYTPHGAVAARWFDGFLSMGLVLEPSRLGDGSTIQ